VFGGAKYSGWWEIPGMRWAPIYTFTSATRTRGTEATRFHTCTGHSYGSATVLPTVDRNNGRVNSRVRQR
jgi:hypothetical protein